MNGNELVLDTNVVIAILEDEAKSQLLDTVFPDNIRVLSVISQIELLAYPGITEEADNLIRKFISGLPVISLDLAVVETAIAIRRHKTSVKLPDAVICATAVELGATLVTNDDDLLNLVFPGFTARGF